MKSMIKLIKRSDLLSELAMVTKENETLLELHDQDQNLIRERDQTISDYYQELQTARGVPD